MDALLWTLVLCCAAVAADPTTESASPTVTLATATPVICSEAQFACASRRWRGGCVPLAAVCDGRAGDCDDGSDETHCGANTEATPPTVTPATATPATCSEAQFACASRRWRGGCVPLAAVCDGRAGDCDDGSDETHCGANTETTSPTVTPATATPATCSEAQFACASRRWRGGCVPLAAVCDGRAGDCDDGSDESQCGNPAVNTAVPQTPAQGGAVKVELPSWLATDQDAHFALSLVPMLRARTPSDKLDAQMAVLRLFRDLAGH